MMCDGHVDPRVSMVAGKTTGVIHEDRFSHNEIHMIIFLQFFFRNLNFLPCIYKN